LKTVEEATIIRHKILYAFEWAERSATEAEAREWLTFVIVGAGATGLELAGALAEIANETLKNDFRRINSERSPHCSNGKAATACLQPIHRTFQKKPKSS